MASDSPAPAIIPNDSVVDIPFLYEDGIDFTSHTFQMHEGLKPTNEKEFTYSHCPKSDAIRQMKEYLTNEIRTFAYGGNIGHVTLIATVVDVKSTSTIRALFTLRDYYGFVKPRPKPVSTTK